MRTLILPLLAYSTLAMASPFNMAYVEVNSNQLSNVACFVRANDDKPFFNMVSIFAANINGKDPNSPEIYFNPQVDHLINQTNQVSMLQAKGIKVLLTLLGNHQNAGWACMTDEKSIERFANDVVMVVKKYNFDGIDIDDEYSNCHTNKTSILRITKAIKNHPGFKNKILSKALFADHDYFQANHEGKRLADFLDYGWEMSYGGRGDNRLNPYLSYGMSKPNLALGANAAISSQGREAARYVVENSFGGVMIYNVRHNSQSFVELVAEEEKVGGIKVLPNCLS